MRQNTGTLLFSDSPSPNSFFPLDTAYRPWGPPSLIFLLMEQDTGGTQNLHSLLPPNILRSSSSLKERQRPSREEGASCSWSRLVAKAHPPIVMLFPFQLPLWCWPKGKQINTLLALYQQAQDLLQLILLFGDPVCTPSCPLSSHWVPGE